MAEIVLTEQSDSYQLAGGAEASIIRGLGGADTIVGGSGNDTLYGDEGADQLLGAGGDDRLVGGLGPNLYSGGLGIDTAVLNGDPQDFALVDTFFSAPYYLLARNASGNQSIREDTEFVEFRSGQRVATADLGRVVSSAGSASDETFDALEFTQITPRQQVPSQRFDGGAGFDTVLMSGTASQYRLFRPSASFAFQQVGDLQIVADGLNGTAGARFLSPSIERVVFADGQYLALKDLPSYVAGDPGLTSGGDADDLLFQSQARTYDLFSGNGGSDTLYLNGNVWDYTSRSYDARIAGTEEQSDLGHVTPATSHGIELVARNGSGLLLIDETTDTIVFRDGESVSHANLAGRVAADMMARTDTLTIVPVAQSNFDGFVADGTDGMDRLLLNGNVDDFRIQIGRDTIELLGPSGRVGFGSIEISSKIETVQFQNGQYLAFDDVVDYIRGSMFGVRQDDGAIYAAHLGDQFISGTSGRDDVYLNGNVGDYLLGEGSPDFKGSALVSKNGSGTLFIDPTVETVHFLNGQYLAYADLGAYIFG